MELFGENGPFWTRAFPYQPEGRACALVGGGPRGPPARPGRASLCGGVLVGADARRPPRRRRRWRRRCGSRGRTGW